MHTGFIEDLCDVHLYPLFESGELDPALDNVEAVFSAVFPYLCTQDWDTVRAIVDEWTNETKLSSVREVTRRFGEAAGEIYRERIALLGIELEPESHSSRIASYRSMRFAHIMITHDPDDIAADLTDLGEEIRRLRRENRERLKKNNAETKQDTLKLGIWFPHSGDMALWHEDPIIGPTKFVKFAALMYMVRRKLTSHKQLQHIPRRRLTVKARLDMTRNMDAMSAFIGIDSYSEVPV